MANCSVDAECPGTLVCYLEPRWTSESNFCDCESWYGWTGEDCTDLGSGAGILIFSALSMALVALLALLVVCSELNHVFQREKEASTKRGKVKVTATGITLSFLLIAFLFILCWRLNAVALVATPEENDLIGNSNGGEVLKLHRRLVYERIFLTVSLLSTAMALLNISLIWLEIANHGTLGSRVVRVKRYRKVIYLFQGTWITLYLICGLLGETALLSFLSIPLLCFLILTYIFGSKALIHLITSQNEEEDMVKVVESVRITSKRVRVSLGLGIFGAFIYAVLTLLVGYRNLYSKDVFVNPAAFFAEFMPLSALLSNISVFLFVYDKKASRTLAHKVGYYWHITSEKLSLAIGAHRENSCENWKEQRRESELSDLVISRVEPEIEGRTSLDSFERWAQNSFKALKSKLAGTGKSDEDRQYDDMKIVIRRKV